VIVAVGVLVFDTLPGLFIGIAMSVLLLIYRACHPHIAVLGKVPGTPGQYGDLERHPDNQQLPGIVILRVESGLFFANADAVSAAGAGLLLLADEVSASAVAEHARTLLPHRRDAGHREAARAIAEEIAGMPSPDQVARRLPELAART